MVSKRNMSKQIEWTVLGRIIGTATGWDQADTFVMNLYGFVPAPDVPLDSSECVFIDFEHGKIEAYDDFGQAIWSKDLIEALSGAKKA